MPPRPTSIGTAGRHPSEEAADFSPEHMVDFVGMRRTVRKLVRGGAPDLQPRRSILEPHYASLERRWTEGCHNGAQLWRELRGQGFTGGLRVVTEWATRQRLGRRTAHGLAPLSCRRVAMLLTADPQQVLPDNQTYLDRLFTAAPEIATVHGLVQRFIAMVKHQRADEFEAWLEDAASSELRSFVTGLRQDKAAVHAALTTPWSNGQVEGQITKLKLMKRSMYGRAKLDLLRCRLLAA